jgi:hypothetical protein
MIDSSRRQLTSYRSTGRTAIWCHVSALPPSTHEGLKEGVMKQEVLLDCQIRVALAPVRHFRGDLRQPPRVQIEPAVQEHRGQQMVVRCSLDLDSLVLVDGHIGPSDPLADTQAAGADPRCCGHGEPVLAVPIDQSDPVAEQALVKRERHGDHLPLWARLANTYRQDVDQAPLDRQLDGARKRDLFGERLHLMVAVFGRVRSSAPRRSWSS